MLPRGPCVLIVGFRLRFIRGRAHRLFEVGSTLNTSLFVGFPGMVSALLVAPDRSGVCGGVYEWDTSAVYAGRESFERLAARPT